MTVEVQTEVQPAPELAELPTAAGPRDARIAAYLRREIHARTMRDRSPDANGLDIAGVPPLPSPATDRARSEVCMAFHVYLFEHFKPGGSQGRPFTFVNLEGDQLQSRVVDCWDRGLPITWDGRTADSSKCSIKVFETTEPVPDETKAMSDSDIYRLIAAGTDVTNEVITGSAGQATISVPEAPSTTTPTASADPRMVMVVHGRNLAAKEAMFSFLRTLGLHPIEWQQAVTATGLGTPHNLQAVRAAMQKGQAVVVIFTAEDQAGLLPDLAQTDKDREDVPLRGQPRQNVILEAGMAMGMNPARTILVELGRVRPASDFEGLNTVRLDNTPVQRQMLRARLEAAGCVITAATDWLTPSTGGDFEAAVVEWQPTDVKEPVTKSGNEPWRLPPSTPPAGSDAK